MSAREGLNPGGGTLLFSINALVITALILTLNLSLRTMLQWDETRWDELVELHSEDLPFRIRPFTNVAVTALVDTFSLSNRDAFVITQYSLIFAFLLSFTALLSKMEFRARERLLGMWALGFSFPILCIHFIPNFTWDDLWAYLGLIWMTYFLLDKRLYPAALCLIFASLSRENVLITAVAFYFFRNPRESWRSWVLPAALGCGVYVLYRFVVFPDFLPGRLSRLPVNFSDINAAKQSIHSLFVSFGWIWTAAGIMTWRTIRDYKANIFSLNWRLSMSALVIGFLTIGLTLIAGLSRETRLFFTPFVFLIPLGIASLSDKRFMENVRSVYDSMRLRYLIAIALTIFAICLVGTILVFPIYSYLPMKDFHRLVFAGNIALSIMIIATQSAKCRNLFAKSSVLRKLA
ncbi:MAG: hypothetical protein IIB00_08410 [candidate division Zixibacteria bacterium]|nr:hypothetical protein [candidate division Zixibacteria bacterium]